jgi:hypothetical protein
MGQNAPKQANRGKQVAVLLKNKKDTAVNVTFLPLCVTLIKFLLKFTAQNKFSLVTLFAWLGGMT